LIGRRDYFVPSGELSEVITRLFFMAHTTGRYTNSPESQIESAARSGSSLASNQVATSRQVMTGVVSRADEERVGKQPALRFRVQL
jgi:hypothetical protein